MPLPTSACVPRVRLILPPAKPLDVATAVLSEFGHSSEPKPSSTVTAPPGMTGFGLTSTEAKAGPDAATRAPVARVSAAIREAIMTDAILFFRRPPPPSQAALAAACPSTRSYDHQLIRTKCGFTRQDPPSC